MIWQSVGMVVLSAMRLSPGIALSFFSGIRDGIKSSRSESFASIPPYVR